MTSQNKPAMLCIVRFIGAFNLNTQIDYFIHEENSGKIRMIQLLIQCKEMPHGILILTSRLLIFYVQGFNWWNVSLIKMY